MLYHEHPAPQISWDVSNLLVSSINGNIRQITWRKRLVSKSIHTVRLFCKQIEIRIPDCSAHHYHVCRIDPGLGRGFKCFVARTRYKVEIGTRPCGFEVELLWTRWSSGANVDIDFTRRRQCHLEPPAGLRGSASAGPGRSSGSRSGAEENRTIPRSFGVSHCELLGCFWKFLLHCMLRTLFLYRGKRVTAFSWQHPRGLMSCLPSYNDYIYIYIL